MRQIIALAALLSASQVLATTCPVVNAADPEPEGWSVVAMSQLSLPGEFISARYITAFGVMQGLVFCDYVDQSGMPFYLMSNDYYADPNPHEDKDSDWIPKRYPFKHHLCNQSVEACAF